MIAWQKLIEDSRAARRVRVVAICDRWPWPVRSGGQHRLAAMLEALSQLGDLAICMLSRHQVDDAARTATLAALPTAHVVEIPRVERRSRRMAYLWLSRRWPWWKPWGRLDFPAIQRSMRATLGQDRFDVVWSYTTLGAPLLGGWGEAVRIVDLPELPDVMRRRAAAVGEPRGRIAALRSKYMQAIDVHAWRRVLKRACIQASLVTVCSENDREALRGEGQLMVVPNSHQIPKEPIARPAATRSPTLLFPGSMDFYSNSDAADFFARDVWPLVRHSLPDAQLRIVGKAGPKVLNLSGEKGVVIAGEVERMEDEHARAHVIVVPLRIGSGTRVKILEAWAYGIPVVSTTVGAEGLPASHAQNLLLADSAPALAEACTRLLTDEGLRTQLAEGGRRTVESTLGRAEIQASLLAAIRHELEERGSAGGSPELIR
jgi:glycosyltransferase involved in cell wall biosynthesis